jgi:Glycosyl transferase family 2
MRLSFVIETENLAATNADRLIAALESLRTQTRPIGPDDEVLLVETGDVPPDILATALTIIPNLRTIRLGDVDGYYPVKSAMAGLAKGDVVVFVDADCVYAPRWLDCLLVPLDDPNTVISAGETFTSVASAWDLAVAVTFMLQPKSGKTNTSPAVSYYINNVAIRRQLLLDEPIARHLAPTFRGTCSCHARALARQGHHLRWAHGAHAVHAQPENFRLLVWRYLLLGSDHVALSKTLSDRGLATPQTTLDLFVSQVRLLGGRWKMLRRTGLAPTGRTVGALPTIAALAALRLVGSVTELVRPGYLLVKGQQVLGD